LCLASPGRLAPFALVLLALTGCAARMERATALQAAHDFNCVSEPIVTERMAFGEYRATGCGKRASYQLVGECFTDWNPCRAARLAAVEETPPAKAR
jgi:hypothetical protein